MDDTTNPETEVEVFDDDVIETEQPEGDQPEESETEYDEDGNPVEKPEPEPELLDIEYEGKQFKVPPELREAFLRHSDYTQKTQELANQRREAEALRDRYSGLVEHAEQLSQAEQLAQVQYANIAQQLARYESVDWQAWRASDPQGATLAHQEMQDLRAAQQRVEQVYGQARNERLSLAQQEAATRLEQGKVELAKYIPDWGETKARELAQHAMNDFGFDAEELQGIDDPRIIRVLHAAHQFTQTQKKTATAAKAVNRTAIRPAAKVVGEAAPRKSLYDPESMSDKEWIAARNRQLANRNKR